MLHSLRRQVIVILLLGTSLLALLNLAINTRGLVAVRNQATNDSTAALQAQAEQYLLRIAQSHAASTGQTVRAVQQLAVTTRTYLQQPTTQSPSLPELSVARNGRQYASGATTVLVIANPDQAQALADIGYSQRLEDVLPSLQISVPEIVRISYLTANTLRTYPNMTPNDPPADWQPSQEAAYVASLPANNPSRALTWTEVHQSIDQSQALISVAAPVYDNAEFLGTVSVDVGLDRLAFYLKGLILDESSFAFLITQKGEVVAVTEAGQGGVVQQILTNQSNNTASSMINDLQAGRDGVTTIFMDGRGYVVAYAAISGIPWALGLASPLDEITERTQETANQIATITNQSLALNIGLALIALVLFGFGMAMILRRQFVKPLTSLIGATNRVADGDLQPIEVESSNELGQLASSFNSMTAALQVARQETEAKEAAREAAMQRLNEVVANLEHSLAERQQLSQLLRDVASPVIPILKGVLVMPLIGSLDGERMQQATTIILSRVERERAKKVLIDITGVPMMDESAAQALVSMIHGLRLLGATVTLVGVGPEVAQSLTALSVDLSAVQTAADLRTAVAQLSRS
ncbi:STAS domain-containing protein [Herpetosiphon llansteffanensis]|uniref:STAS domain-containing protein n=1 Tax=Herpetosiphon llansteffanensis TaxID=2094568 RepID=UPI000D7BB16A|nr:STAS domain-containing protein [Herpetosiphon llansteffanensis]